MMLPSRKLAAMFGCVFVLGAVAGALVSMNFSDLRFYNFLNRTNDPASLAQRINSKLTAQYSLDADEQARIAPYTKEMAQNLYVLRHQFSTDVLDTIDASHVKIAAQMSPAHREAYEKDNLDRRKRAASMLMPVTATLPGGTAGADGSHP
jgi:hypothetical protein